MTKPGSLAYRNAEEEIRKGHPPKKYTRLLPYITGDRILEIGSAEGVLALTFCHEKKPSSYIALELREDRHENAVKLKTQWEALNKNVGAVTLKVGDIRDNLELFDSVDTVVFIRSIYYLREDIDRVMLEAYKRGVKRVVLCGNKNRAAQSMNDPMSDEGIFNKPASEQGMMEILVRAGYNPTRHLLIDDPVVTGCR